MISVIKWMILQVLILIGQAHLNNVLFVSISVLDKGFRFQLTVCNGFYDALMMSIHVNSILQF